MLRTLNLGLAAAALAALACTTPAAADTKRPQRAVAATEGAEHPKSGYYRGPRVKGFLARRGGYSYAAEDVINTYGQTRSNTGMTSVFRDPMLDRQSRSGPFDHGFFFDAGGPRGSNSPYPN